nr:MAG TPA: virion morphogenesis protein [Caudoviricetes sp.]
MQLTIQAITTHLDAIDDALSQLTERMADLTEPMLGIGMLLETSISERIRDSKQSPDAEDWADVKGKERDQILIGLGMQGGLLSGITSVEDSHSVIAGSDKFYAQFLQMGTRRMVARPFLGISSQDEQDIADMLLDEWLGGSLD